MPDAQGRGRTQYEKDPPEKVETVQRQIAECKRLRALNEELIEVSDRLCRARPGTDTAPRREAVQREFACDVGIELEALEIALESKVMALAARALERHFNSDCGDRAARHQTCQCGRKARYGGRLHILTVPSS